MQSIQVLSDTFAALGDATRLAILSRLASEGDMTVREIARPFAMSLPAVSQHLKVLERAGLIARGRDGQKRPCRLNAERLTETARFRPSRKVKTMSHDPRTTWALEREIVLSRVIAAPRSRVFQAFTDPSQITRWFGPEGFTTQTLEIDIREGGRWRFVYTGPDGTRYENRMVFLRVDAPRLLEIEHGSDVDDDPARFHVTITFDEQSDGKCVLTMRQLHPTKEQRDATIGFGAVELGYQTLDKLAWHLAVGDLAR